MPVDNMKTTIQHRMKNEGLCFINQGNIALHCSFFSHPLFSEDVQVCFMESRASTYEHIKMDK